MVANGDLETSKDTVELKFEVGDIEFHELFIVMKKLSSPINGLMFLQRNHTVLDMLQGILNLLYFSMQLKTADHKYSYVMEHLLSPDDVTIRPNDHMSLQYSLRSMQRMQSQECYNLATFCTKKAT